MERRAKIAGTLGPACDAPAVLAELVEAGLDVARLNFSHGRPDEHRARVERLRRTAATAGRAVALLGDVQGPRFRVGRVEGGEIALEPGSTVVVVAGRERAGAGELPVSYAALARDVRRGDRILIDDGKVELRVERVQDERVRCEVVRGGPVRDRKGINLPGVALSVPSLTPKDRRDLRLAVELGADWLAVSFVRRPEDVRAARALLRRAGRDLPVMAKIERPEAIDRLDGILAEADALLVARGDLGVELPPEDVPILQKQIVEAANAAGKPVMTATQMLDSMQQHRRPTRAEATDVANAVLDGSDALLLTAETAVGAYPVEAVRMMDRIVRRAESARRTAIAPPPPGTWSRALATCRAGSRAAQDVDARCLVAFTESGFTARQAARFRPDRPLVAYTPHETVARQLALVWGVSPRTLERADTIEGMLAGLDRALAAEGLAGPGDAVVVLAGTPIGEAGTTNLMQIHRIAVAVTSEASRRRSRQRSPGKGPRGGARRRPAAAVRTRG